MMKNFGFMKMAALIAPMAFSMACASAGDSSNSGDGDGDTAGDGDTTGDGDMVVTGDGDGDVAPGDGDGDVVAPGDGDGDGMTPGDGDGDNPFQADWDLLTMQATDSENLDQCMGFTDGPGTPYRTYGVDDPNPKDGDSCAGAGNTSAMDGSCNVPAGFERNGLPIGNKACSCDAVLGFDCSAQPLPGITFGTPTACDGSAGTGPKGTYAELIDETPCGAEFDTCMSPDLPASDGTCEWTTPKGCVCLADTEGALVWQCASTNSWFDCTGDGCPWEEADITSGADIKTNCGSCGAASCL